MKRMALAIVLPLFAALHASAAEPAKGGFWDNLKAKIEKVTPSRKSSVNTAVGGVRSAKQQDAELYWKGKDPLLEADRDELDLFKQALNKAIRGEREESIKLFEAFLGRYTQSQLKEDCLKALEQLRERK